MKKLTLIIAMSSLLLTACACGGGGFNYSIIHTGKEFGKPLSYATIVNSKAEYDRFVSARAIKLNNPVSGFDFTKNSLLLVYAGKDTCKGCGLEIINISDKDKVTVEVQEKAGAPANTFIKIPKTDKKATIVKR